MKRIETFSAEKNRIILQKIVVCASPPILIGFTWFMFLKDKMYIHPFILIGLSIALTLAILFYGRNSNQLLEVSISDTSMTFNSEKGNIISYDLESHQFIPYVLILRRSTARFLKVVDKDDVITTYDFAHFKLEAFNKIVAILEEKQNKIKNESSISFDT